MLGNQILPSQPDPHKWFLPSQSDPTTSPFPYSLTPQVVPSLTA